MQRLSGLDAGFLYMETSTCPMHVASLMVLDPSTASGGFDFDRLRARFAERLHLAPPFRRRLVPVPMGLHHPVWIEDPDFDLDWHLRHIAVPSPGGMSELCELAGHLVAIPLDRGRPLWEAWLIEGVEGGRQALLTKVHHAAVDGTAGEELMVALLDLAPDEDKPPPTEPWVPDPVPTDAEMLVGALGSLAHQPVRAVKTARRTVEATLRIREANRRDQDLQPPPSPFSAPRTSFNAALTSHRAFATSSLPLAEVKAVKDAAGVKVNDVVLALCAGALRHYLDRLGEVPDAPLVAMVPISVRVPGGDPDDRVNRISSSLTTLATDVDDPLERLAAVHAGMSLAKEQQELIGADMLQDWAQFAAPAVAGQAARLYSRMRVADRHRPLFNVTISNVPGPPFPLYIAGAELVSTFPMGPIFDGAGVNITVMSYRDHLDVGFVVCPELVPQPWLLARGMRDALAELVAATGVRPVATTPEPTAPVAAPAPGSGPLADRVPEAQPVAGDPPTDASAARTRAAQVAASSSDS